MSGGSVASRSSSSPTLTSRPGSHSSTASEKQGVPRVGGVRCYWAFLSPRRPDPSIPGSKLELMFVHLDPVLAVHMAAQKMSLLGRGILEFIHPGEREDARRDLTNAIASDDLQGSVTRVRFARLSCIRKILGSKPEDLELPFDASSFTEDEEYLILDLVLNWVADGLLLAFFHAIRDKDPVANNDRNKQHEEWSNFCGTAKMGEEQVAALQADIEACLPPVPRSRFPPTRVLQLHTSINHSNTPGGLLFSWPPARPPDRQGLVPLYDGMYQAEEYVGLMAGVSLDPQQHLVNESRTNCTTRYGAKHSINSEGLYRHIVSVFIPYGNIIFACFQTVKQVELVQRVSIGVQPSPYPPPAQEWPSSDATDLAAETRDSDPDYGIVTPRNQDWEYSAPMEGSWSGEHAKSDDYAQLPVHSAGPSYDIHGHQSQPHLSAPHTHHGSHPHQQTHSEHYRNASAPQLTSNHHQISHPGHLTHSSSLPLSQSDPANGFQRFEMNSFPAASRSPYDHNVSIPPPGSDQYPREPGYPPTGTYALEDDSPPSATYAKPHTRVLSEDGGGEEHGGANAHSASGNGGGSSSRPMIRPPGDIERCRICGTTESPEWRRSEAGIKDLCNACGLRLARQVAKREGRQKPRKKKDK